MLVGQIFCIGPTVSGNNSPYWLSNSLNNINAPGHLLNMSCTIHLVECRHVARVF